MGSILDVASFLVFRVLQISNTNPIYKYCDRFLFCSLSTQFNNVVLFPLFQTSARMWYCLYAYHIVGDNVYDLGKLDCYDSIFILCSIFSCTFLIAWVPVDRVSHLEKKSSFLELKFPRNYQYWHLRSKNFR